jgi:hypothetical protein
MNKKPTQQRTPGPPTQHPRRNLASKQEKRKTIAKESADSPTQTTKRSKPRSQDSTSTNTSDYGYCQNNKKHSGTRRSGKRETNQDKPSKQMENEANIFSVLLLNIVTNLWFSL